METTERIKVGNVANKQFYTIPKALIDSAKYQDLSIPAKLVYSLLLDRMHLSVKNGWYNEKEEIYLIFSQSKLATKLHKSKASVNNYMSELKDFGLIDVVNQKSKEKGNMPALVYIRELPVLSDEEALDSVDDFVTGNEETPFDTMDPFGEENDVEYPGQNTEHPGQYDEHPGQYDEHPGQYTDPNKTIYNKTIYSNTEKVNKEDDEDENRGVAPKNVDNFLLEKKSLKPLTEESLIEEYAKEIRQWSRGTQDLTDMQKEYIKGVIRQYSPPLFSQALTIATVHQNLKLPYLASILKNLIANNNANNNQDNCPPMVIKARSPVSTNLKTSRNSTNDQMLAQCLDQTLKIMSRDYGY